MDSKAMDPFGEAMLAYFEGEETAQLRLRRDDGLEIPIPVSHFFRDPANASVIDKAALEACTGHVLDVGAGSGLHSLALISKGHEVTSIDISPHAVDIMKRRGLTGVACADIFDFDGGSFDTVLMMGHGIGMVETIAGLQRFLSHVSGLVAEGGQVLLDSLDARVSEDPTHKAYLEANRRASRYFGEIRMQAEFKTTKAPLHGWLHVDPETLTRHAAEAGWRCSVLCRDEHGNYAARLNRA